jgi:ABC-type Fe3+-hydroxamate transport system substrate-binding protein
MEKPVDFPPQRVVSLVPSVTESLFDLALGNRLVGVTEYCEKPAAGVANLPKVGGTKNPDVERIRSLQPDLVIMNREENRREDAEALQAAGINVWVTEPNTVMEAINLLWNIMDIFDEASMVPRIRQIEKMMDIVSPAMRAGEPLRTFVPIWRDPWMTISAGTYVHDLMAVLGMENVFGDRERRFPLAADIGEGEALADDDPRIANRDRRYPRISLEEVAAAKPDLILLPTEPYVFSEDDADVFLEMDIPAAAVSNIYLVDGSLLTWHGTRLSHALYELPPILKEARERVDKEQPTGDE